MLKLNGSGESNSLLYIKFEHEQCWQAIISQTDTLFWYYKIQVMMLGYGYWVIFSEV